MKQCCLLLITLAFLNALSAWAEDEDPYVTYIKISKDFKRVTQDKKFAKALPGWTVMPWYAAWPIGQDDASGQWCLDHGINGSFVNRGETGYLAWIDKFKLRFYADHTAGKGDLHIWDGGHGDIKQLSGTGVRAKPMNDAMMTKLKGVVKGSITNLKDSPNRGAYALDDEISWGHFNNPCMWRVTDDAAAYPKWLEEIYGKDKAPKRPNWVSYNDFFPKLRELDIAGFDASPLMDQWTFNDAYFNNFVGDLVEYANTLDGETPCGFVGGQLPDAFGGFDYARVCRKIQFIESYGANEYVRGMNPMCLNAATLFYNNTNDTIWQSWSQVASGQHAMICWVDDNWWQSGKPKPFLDEMAPTWKELTQKIAPLLNGAERSHDGVALYYNHPSMQLGWIMDAEAHRKTWPNRKAADPGLACSLLVHKAWMNMLRDEGYAYNWVSYADVIEKGIPAEYKVLILTHTLCLSDAEAKKIKEFCTNGGTVIADYLPGLWDQHGKGRAEGGALDDMFGVKHDPKMKSADIFGGVLWAETDQDSNFGKPAEVLLTNGNTCIKDASGFNKAVRKMDVNHVNKFGKGTAVLMNLSPQWYDAYRPHGFADAGKRSIFMKHIADAGIKSPVRIKNAGEKEFGYEIIQWKKDGRTLLFLLSNAETSHSSEGGGNSKGLKTEKLPVTLEFATPVKNCKDERTGKDLGAGKEIQVEWKMNEAVVLSYE